MLAVLAGIALTANLMVSVVYQQRRELAALKALGSRTSTLVGVVLVQALCLGGVGGLLGVAVTIPIAAGLDAIAVSIVGFENVVRTPPWVLGAGFAIAAPISLIGTASQAGRSRSSRRSMGCGELQRAESDGESGPNHAEVAEPTAVLDALVVAAVVFGREVSRHTVDLAARYVVTRPLLGYTMPPSTACGVRRLPEDRFRFPKQIPNAGRAVE